MHYYMSGSTIEVGSDRIWCQPPLGNSTNPAVLTNNGNRDWDENPMLQITDRTDKLSESRKSVKIRGEGDNLSDQAARSGGFDREGRFDRLLTCL